MTHVRLISQESIVYKHTTLFVNEPNYWLLNRLIRHIMTHARLISQESIVYKHTALTVPLFCLDSPTHTL